MLLNFVLSLFNVDRLSIVMMALIFFVGVIVTLFSTRYMKGDSHYRSYFLNLMVMIAAVIVLVMSDHLILFYLAWCVSNWMMAKLIIHKGSWKAAKASGRLASRNFVIGAVAIAGAFGLLGWVSGSTSIAYLVHNVQPSVFLMAALVLLAVGAMTQCAIWPFHRWLTSSLNSPTPVSAIMHAGIINGGGFLLARFAPLLLQVPDVLIAIFVGGLVTAIIGSLWKLMQHDVKRMLASSTMGQMGFMIAQCGLGLFASALAHLFWHGLYKAYLFLASGGSARHKRLDMGTAFGFHSVILGILTGAFGSFLFATVSQIEWLALNTSIIVTTIVFVTATQFAITILGSSPYARLPIAMILTSILSVFYGVNVYLFEHFLGPMNLMRPQALHLIHYLGMLGFVGGWVGVIAVKALKKQPEWPKWMLVVYVRMLNASQPHPSTITAHRTGYDYV